MTKETYTEAFNNFTDFIHSFDRYSQIQFLDVIYYYDIEPDECATKLECGGGEGKEYLPGRNISIDQYNTIHAEGYVYTASKSSFAITGNTASGTGSFAEGGTTTAIGDYSHSEGTNCKSYGSYSHTEGEGCETSGGTYATHAEGKYTKANANFSHAEGDTTETNGESAHSEGKLTKANGYASHAEGNNTLAEGGESHSEGKDTKAYGLHSHVEGYSATTNGSASHAEGTYTLAYGGEAHAEGKNTRAYGDQSHSEGLGDNSSTASNITLYDAYIHKNDSDQIAELYVTKGHGFIPGDAIKYGDDIPRGIVDIQSDPNNQWTKDLITITPYNLNENIWHLDTNLGTIQVKKYPKTFGSAYGISSHTEGKSIAIGNFSHGEGYDTMAIGHNSHAVGTNTQAKGSNSATFGENTISDYHRMHVIGRYNRTTGYYPSPDIGQYDTHWEDTGWPYKRGQELLTVGYGDAEDKRRTIFKVIGQYEHNNNGEYWWGEAYTNYVICWEVNANRNNVIGNDYAEYLEWFDGNPNGEDRVGRFVKLNGDKIEIANQGDDVIGVVSSTPGVIGNASETEWNSKYMKDVYGRKIVVSQPQSGETTIMAKDVSGDTSNCGNIQLEKIADYEINPNYNPSIKYIPRSKRKEWAIIGFMGQFIVDDDGTCVPGKRCVATDGGIATSTTSTTKGYRVMRRIDDTHIKILVTSF